jgi:hypothetical protein
VAARHGTAVLLVEQLIETTSMDRLNVFFPASLVWEEG